MNAIQSETRHGAISEIELTRIRPSPENDELYGPVLSDDPDVIALAKSIRQHGLKEPIVLTRDCYILSGHRRFAACKAAGLTRVPCRVEDLPRSAPEFLTLLREFNRQRVKPFDVVAREEVVSANPEEAHRFLQQYRKNKARVTADSIQITGTKQRAAITSAKTPFLQAIMAVLNERRAFWPLTDRQIHYALLNDPPLVHARKPSSRYENSLTCYKACCELITRARLTGQIPFNAIHDPTRPVVTWNFNKSAAPYIRAELANLLKGYYRDLQQSQPCQIEIIGEKNTIQNIIEPVAMEYCIPLTIGRGYCSLPPRYSMAQRFKRSGKDQLVILAVSDFDPEGEDIAHSFARSLRDDFGVKDVVPIKVALTARQVTEMRLPPGMKVKKKSSRAKKFTGLYGDNVYELEAVPPDRLQEILREAIDGVLDIEAYNQEIDAEKEDAAHLENLRRRIHGAIGSTLENEGN